MKGTLNIPLTRAQESVMKYFDCCRIDHKSFDFCKGSSVIADGHEYTINLYEDIFCDGQKVAVSNLPHDLSKIGLKRATSWAPMAKS